MRITVQHNTQEKTNVEENNKQNKERNTISQRKENEGKQHTGRAFGGKGPPTRGEIASVETDQSTWIGHRRQRKVRTHTEGRGGKELTTRKKPRNRSN